MNKKKIYFIVAVCAINLGWNVLQAQEKLIVHPTGSDASVWEVAMTSIGKITLSDTRLTFKNAEGTTLKEFIYSDIHKLTFDLGGTDILNNKLSQELTLYPNPATDYIQIIGWDSTKPEERIAIYSTSGELYYQTDEWQGNPIKVSSLPQGSYVLKTKNQSFKFRKL